MKCKFCEADLLPGKDKCDYCGKYQHEIEVKKEESKDGNKSESVESILRKKRKIFAIISIILLVAIIGFVAWHFITQYLDNQYPFFGLWKCDNGKLELDISSESFKMNFDASGYQEAEFIIKTERNKETYNLNVSPVKKTINGGTFVDDSNTSFQVNMDKDNSLKMVLKNLTTNKEYTCYKADK